MEKLESLDSDPQGSSSLLYILKRFRTFSSQYLFVEHLLSARNISRLIVNKTKSVFRIFVLFKSGEADIIMRINKELQIAESAVGEKNETIMGNWCGAALAMVVRESFSEDTFELKLE